MGSQEAAVVIIHKDLEWEIFIPSVYASTYDRYIPVRNLRINKGGPSRSQSTYNTGTLQETKIRVAYLLITS